MKAREGRDPGYGELPTGRPGAGGPAAERGSAAVRSRRGECLRGLLAPTVLLLAALLLPAVARPSPGVRVVAHADRLPPVPDAAWRSLLPARARIATAASAASATPGDWCGEPTFEEYGPARAHTIKVVYAYPRGGSDRFGVYSDLIQRDVEAARVFYARESGGAVIPRFDLGTACGPSYVDVRKVELPRPREGYPADAARAALVLAQDLSNLLGPDRDYLVYVDGLASSGDATGVATMASDDSAGPDNRAASGGFFGFVIGDGSPAFNRARTLTAIHELTHTLGAVQDSAPHSTGAGHCFDEQDVMCYDDGGPRVPHPLPRPRCSADPLPRLDCGRDDYFAPTPPANSYLARHWNVARSPFLCGEPECPASELAQRTTAAAKTRRPQTSATGALARRLARQVARAIARRGRLPRTVSARFVAPGRGVLRLRIAIASRTVAIGSAWVAQRGPLRVRFTLRPVRHQGAQAAAFGTLRVSVVFEPAALSPRGFRYSNERR